MQKYTIFINFQNIIPFFFGTYIWGQEQRVIRVVYPYPCHYPPKTTIGLQLLAYHLEDLPRTCHLWWDFLRHPHQHLRCQVCHNLNLR